MSEADIDGDGKISLKDFMQMMKQYIDTHVGKLNSK
jgi:Ca2+-binding EF-hand superfamily protein